MADRVAVLLTAGGEPWEASALAAARRRRAWWCSSAASTSPTCWPAPRPARPTSRWSPASSAGLDADAVMQLLRDDVRCVAVGGSEEALARIGVVSVVVQSTELRPAPEAVASAGTRALVVDPDPVPEPEPRPSAAPGRVVAVHGPAGAPGRTTLAIGLAAEHAHRGDPSVLVDADPHGGAVAQHLGVLDEVSGLLAAARLVNAGIARRGVVRALPPGGGRPASRCSPACRDPTAGWRPDPACSTPCSSARPRSATSWSTPGSASRTTPTSAVRSRATS